MARVIESVGNTYDEALKKGLEELGLTEDDVNVEVVKDQNQAFFSILEKRTVKLRLSEKHPKAVEKEEAQKPKEIVELDEDTINVAKSKIEAFLDEFISNMGLDVEYEVSYSEGYMRVNIAGESSALIIGHRGETLEALQTILTATVNKESESRIKIIIDSEKYRERRANSLKQLALREAEQVIKRKKNFTFEPMSAFERKAIHSALQNNSKVTTFSVGEEPYRKVVISLK